MFQKYALNKLGNGRKNLMFCRKNGNGRDIKFGLWILYIRFRKKIIKSNTIKRRDKTKKYLNT